MNRVQGGVLVLLVVFVAASLAVVGSGSVAASDDAASTTAVEADSVEFRITVSENASARWTFTYTRILENETQREHFRAFADEFNTNETDSFRQFRNQAGALAASGRNATGREMRAEDFSRSAELGGNCVTAGDCGTIKMSFTWTEFAAVEGDLLVVGDVFGSGLFLSPSQHLVFEAGPGLDFESASPGDYTPSAGTLEESDSITYDGDRSFSDQRPRVTFRSADQTGTDAPGTTTAPAGATGTTAPPTGDQQSPGTNPGDEQEGFPMALIGGLLVVLVGTGAAIVWWRGDGAGAITIGDDGDDGGSAAEGTGSVTSDPSVTEEELLTDEDRVLQLLEDNGGRMKQVHIVDETGWSKSKVSMLLSEMDDEDQISKLRVGRENIISLAGHEPEAAGSPHDED